MKKTLIALAIAAGIVLTGCSNDADVVSANISKDADSFKVSRQIVFYNGITGEYIAEVNGKCSIGNKDEAGKLSVTCKVGEDKYIKNYLGLSDNVTWFALQTSASEVSDDRYTIIFKPSTVIPKIDIR